MRLPAQLPHNGFNGERQLAPRFELGTFFFRFIRLIQIHAAIGALHQVVVNVRSAIATFGFIVFGPRSGGEAGGHYANSRKCGGAYKSRFRMGSGD